MKAYIITIIGEKDLTQHELLQQVEIQVKMGLLRIEEPTMEQLEYGQAAEVTMMRRAEHEGLMELLPSPSPTTLCYRELPFLRQMRKGQLS